MNDGVANSAEDAVGRKGEMEAEESWKFRTRMAEDKIWRCFSITRSFHVYGYFSITPFATYTRGSNR